MSIVTYIHRGLRYIVKGTPIINIKANIGTLSVSEILKGRKIIITGGSKGIGYALAKRLLMDGAEVLICGRSVNALQDVAQNLGCKYLPLDLADIDSFDNFLCEADELLGGFDTLINNAGISLHENCFSSVTPNGFRQQFSTNLMGPYFLTQKFIEIVKNNNREAVILMVSSETGDTCDFRPYGLTKVALNSFTRGIAHLYKKMGIRVNAISPGVTASEMTGFSETGNLSANDYGAGRIYLPEEVASVASFLISDLAKCISGQIICCNNANTINARWK